MTQKRRQNDDRVCTLLTKAGRRKKFLVEWRVWREGKRVRRYRGFASEGERAAFVRELQRVARDDGRRALDLPDARVVREWRELEDMAGVPLRLVVDFYLEHRGRLEGWTVEEGVSAFLDDRRGRFDDNQERLMEQRCRLFAAAMRGRKLGEVSVPMCQAWLDRLELAAVTVNNYRIAVNACMNWLVRVGRMRSNPMAGTRRARVERVEAPFYSAREALRFFRVNEQVDPGLCGLVALSAFAGLRSSAVLRLRPEDVRLRGTPRGILTRAADQKRGRRYFVENYPENLWGWVERIPPGDWGLAMEVFYKRRRAAYARAGLPEKKNGWRHAFASHHSAAAGTAAETAYLLQHRSAALLWETYKDNVSARNGRWYFGIVPRKRVTKVGRQWKSKRKTGISM